MCPRARAPLRISKLEKKKIKDDHLVRYSFFVLSIRHPKDVDETRG